MMAIRPLVSQANPPRISPTFSSHIKPSLETREIALKALHSKMSRRIGAIATLASVLLAGDAIFNKEFANGLDFSMVAPEQTVEEAESVIRGHARELVEVKALLDSQSWGVAQKELRRSSSRLKQDLFTIIQSKPGRERPPLRKLYEVIFSNVSNSKEDKLKSSLKTWIRRVGSLPQIHWARFRSQGRECIASLGEL